MSRLGKKKRRMRNEGSGCYELRIGVDRQSPTATRCTYITEEAGRGGRTRLDSTMDNPASQKMLSDSGMDKINNLERMSCSEVVLMYLCRVV